VLLNKISKSRKGISPILATLLLIVIAVAAVIVTYAWVMTFTTTQTSAAGKMIKFDSAVIDVASGNVTVYVRNTGTEVVTVDKIYISGIEYSSSDLPATLTTTGSTSTATIRLQPGLTFSEGTYYKVKVAGAGVFWEENVKAT